MNKHALAAAMAFALIATATPAAAVTITFDTSSSFCAGPTIGGFRFANVGSSCVGVTSSGTNYAGNGSTNLLYGYGSFAITATNGAAFTIADFLAGIGDYSSATSASVNYTLALAAGGTTTGSFGIDRTLQNVALNSAAITRATFSGLGDGYVAFDDVNIYAVVAAAPIPESATWAMMLLGFGGLGHALRRRAKVGPRIRFA